MTINKALNVTGVVTATTFSGTATNATHSSNGGHIANQIADIYDKIATINARLEKLNPGNGNAIMVGGNWYAEARDSFIRMRNATKETIAQYGVYGYGGRYYDGYYQPGG
jgi:hypothetical protein